MKNRTGARERRGAGNEPKCKRAREEGPQPKSLVGQSDDGLSPSELAKALANPTTTAFRIAMQAHKDVDLGAGPAWDVYADELRAASAKLRANDFSHVEDILMQQAEALQAIFTRLAERALTGTQIPSIDLFFRYGLRAQAQCRATLETLATIKNPPAFLFARQANVAAGPQQVNNGTAPTSRAGQKKSERNELSGESGELRQDSRTPELTSGANPALAPVGALDRAAHIRGQSKGCT